MNVDSCHVYIVWLQKGKLFEYLNIKVPARLNLSSNYVAIMLIVFMSQLVTSSASQINDLVVERWLAFLSLLEAKYHAHIDYQRSQRKKSETKSTGETTRAADVEFLHDDLNVDHASYYLFLFHNLRDEEAKRKILAETTGFLVRLSEHLGKDPGGYFSPLVLSRLVVLFD